MGVRIEPQLVPVSIYPKLSFEYRYFSFWYCDYCEKRIPEIGRDMCRNCRMEFERIAAQLKPAFGRHLEPEQLKSLGFGPQPCRFRYGKPWQEHLPPHERERYGLHT